MVNKNIKYYPLWKELFDYYKDVGYGTFISYGDLSNCIEVDILEKRYIFERFKKEMLFCKDKALECVRGKGYRVVQPNEHFRLAGREIKRAERRARQGVAYALHVPFDMLNDREKAQLTLLANRVQNVHASLVGESKSIKSVSIKYDMPGTPRPKLERRQKEMLDGKIKLDKRQGA